MAIQRGSIYFKELNIELSSPFSSRARLQLQMVKRSYYKSVKSKCKLFFIIFFNTLKSAANTHK